MNMSSVHWSSAWRIYNYWFPRLSNDILTRAPASSLLIQPLPQSYASIRSEEMRHCSTPLCLAQASCSRMVIEGAEGEKWWLNLLVWVWGAPLCLLCKPSQGSCCSSLSLHKTNKEEKRRERIHGTRNTMLTAVASKLIPPQHFHRILDYDKKEVLVSTVLSLCCLPQAFPSLQRLKRASRAARKPEWGRFPTILSDYKFTVTCSFCFEHIWSYQFYFKN